MKILKYSTKDKEGNDTIITFIQDIYLYIYSTYGVITTNYATRQFGMYVFPDIFSDQTFEVRITSFNKAWYSTKPLKANLLLQDSFGIGWYIDENEFNKIRHILFETIKLT